MVFYWKVNLACDVIHSCVHYVGISQLYLNMYYVLMCCCKSHMWSGDEDE